MTEYGIGYTIFRYEGNKKVPVLQFHAVKGNISHGMSLLEKRIKKIGNNRMMMNTALWTMVYGYTIRTLIAL